MHYHENKSFPELLKKAETHYAQKLPFVLYRKPEGKRVFGLFQRNNQVHTTTEYDREGFVFAPFDTKGKTILMLPDEAFSSEYAVSGEETTAISLPEPDESDRKKYLELISKALGEIKAGRLKKVVLSRKIEFNSVASPLLVFQQILARYSRALCYLWYHPEIGVWAGASPEVFLDVSNNRLTTMALAGTQKFRDNAPPLWGSKEKEEQALVTSFILETLKDKVSHLESFGPVSARAGHLWHLKTTISGIMKNTSIKEVIKALHPTPAICGLPLKEAREFLQQYETYDRKFYTGFLGELKMGPGKSTQLFVNLRCLQIQQGFTILYIGGGITRDSVPLDEWQETLDKTAIMAEALFNSQE
ncbi:MAG: chorismate-binding protein [Eudoraea sp.]|nr:chorismate-binding protein [Eudoraea sp.]